MDDETVRRRGEELEHLKVKHGALSPEWIAGRDRLLEAVNDQAAAKGALFIRRVKLEYKFSPNHPATVLIERGDTRLYLEPWYKDPDQGPIEFLFKNCDAATFSPPNDENLRLSPLDPLGLGWWRCVTVGNSPWAQLYPWHEVTHYAFLLKDHCFHALAEGFTESRIKNADFAVLKSALDGVPWHVLPGTQKPARIAFP